MTHWNAARRIAGQLGFEADEADHVVDALAMRTRRELDGGASPARALARALDAIEVLPQLESDDSTMVLPVMVAASGFGHEFACAIVALETARRVSIEARLVLLPDQALVIVRDADRQWTAVLPRMGEVSWTCMPAAYVASDDAFLCCPHDAARTTLRLLSSTLDAEQLPSAMSLVDELTAC